jgi:heme exporter protein CcmB
VVNRRHMPHLFGLGVRVGAGSSRRPAARFLAHAATVAWKDLRVELRTREILSTMVFFAVMIVLVCSFTFVEKVPSIGDLSSGILWIAVAFSGTLGLGRAFDREREGSTMRALLLAPAPRGAIFLGKAVGIVGYMLIVEAVVLPAVGVLFGTPLARHPLELLLVMVLCTLGFATVGSVFAGMLLRSRAREVLLPVILYPVLMPALIAGIKGTSVLWQPGPDASALPQAWFWIKFLLVFDAIFLTVALWAFESLVVE